MTPECVRKSCLDDLKESWLAYMSVLKSVGRQPRTLETYQETFTYLKAFIASATSHPQRDAPLTPSLYKKFLSTWPGRKDKGLSRSRMRTSMSAVAGYNRWLLGLGKPPLLFGRQPKLGRKEKPIPRALTRTMAEGLFKTARSLGPYYELLFLLLYGAGLRAHEAAHCEIDPGDRRTLRVVVKGGYERRIFLPEKIMLRVHELGYPSPPILRHNGKPVDRFKVYTAVRKMKESAPFYCTQLSPHTFRHSIATHLLENKDSMSLGHVQRYLGHKSISSTQIYTPAENHRLRHVYLTSHPHAQEHDDPVS